MYQKSEVVMALNVYFLNLSLIVMVQYLKQQHLDLAISLKLKWRFVDLDEIEGRFQSRRN